MASNYVADTWVDSKVGGFTTNQRWGAGLCAAYVAKDFDRKYIYVLQTKLKGS